MRIALMNTAAFMLLSICIVATASIAMWSGEGKADVTVRGGADCCSGEVEINCPPAQAGVTCQKTITRCAWGGNGGLACWKPSNQPCNGVTATCHTASQQVCSGSCTQCDEFGFLCAENPDDPSSQDP